MGAEEWFPTVKLVQKGNHRRYPLCPAHISQPTKTISRIAQTSQCLGSADCRLQYTFDNMDKSSSADTPAESKVTDEGLTSVDLNKEAVRKMHLQPKLERTLTRLV